MVKPASTSPVANILLVVIAAAAILAHPSPTESFGLAGREPAWRGQAWHNPMLSPETRAEAAVRAMTLDEKIRLVHTHVGVPSAGKPKPPGAIGSAAIWPGVPRLGIPPVQEADGSLGVTNPMRQPQLYDVTALPSGLAIAATFDPDLAHAGGAMIGAEARTNGFGVLLAGGANLVRDPRGGRSFEFAGEDPLLTGRIVGATVAGIQSAGVISTVKHFAINDEETGRTILSADLQEQAARESDLLAFEIAIEHGRPGAVMTSYNRVNGSYTSENAALLTILKGDWHYPGFVMSDWGGTHSTRAAAVAGLDQQSGEEYDRAAYFAEPLQRAVEADQVPRDRLDDMVRRVLRSDIAAGLVDRPVDANGIFEGAAHAAVARRIADSGIVLLKNDRNALPLRADVRRIVVIGAHADRGVLSGGGSSQVLPPGTEPFSEEQPPHVILGIKSYHPSAPVDAIRRRATGADVVFFDGLDQHTAVEAARDADEVIVFAEQWLAESRDASDLSLPGAQNQLIDAVAAVNRHVVVVLETGSAVTMPWLDRVPAVVEAWYSGSRGGDAIAAVLFGDVNPSGRLPITFPAGDAQLPRPRRPDAAPSTAQPGGSDEGGFDVDYNIEGADVGYRWYARTGQTPLFPFGFGLGYTSFSYSDLDVKVVDGSLTASITIRNDGRRAGIDTPQVYVEPPGDHDPLRLVAWDRLALAPGESRRVTMTAEPRLLARFDVGRHAWQMDEGRYRVSVRPNAAAPGVRAEITLPASTRVP